MFTGLVETTGAIERVEQKSHQARLVVGVALEDLELGESISVSGVCLTVAAFDARSFAADVSAETLRVTTLGELTAGQRVNLERATRLGQRLGGHMVLGHVDGVAEVVRAERVGDGQKLWVRAGERLGRYLAPKGSVALDGVSLTVNEVRGAADFSLMLVPHTLAVTTLVDVAAGRRMNIEIDVLARYVARQLEGSAIASAGASSLQEALDKGGFLD